MLFRSNFVSTGFPGFAAVVGADRPVARAVGDFVVALFGVVVFFALVVFFAALARRALTLLPDFAFESLADLLFATDREARDAGAAGLRLRAGLDAVDALLFFAAVRDDFVFAFFRAAMAKTLHARGFAASETCLAGDKSPDC